ncbi:MAG TPA: hypothetical protein VGE90_10585 [Chitinophaga sp.]
MFRLLFCLSALLLSAALVHAQQHRFTISAGGAVNSSDFNWSIAGNMQGQSPNVLSALQFNKVTSVGIYIEGSYRPFKWLELNGSYQKNGTISGDGVDTDYEGDNRTHPTYNETFTSDRGWLETFTAGAQACFLSRERYRLKAGLFYTSSTQNYYLLNADLEDLRSTYTAKWYGPKLSIGADYNCNKKWTLSAAFAYYLVKYKATANWNLIAALMHPVSFRQTANGNMVDGQLGLRYALNSFCSLSLTGLIGRAETSKGLDVTYTRTNNQISTQFNGAHNNYYGLRIGAGISF